MATVVVPAYLQPFAGGAARVTVEPPDAASAAVTVRDVLRALGARHPGVVERVLTERGEIRPHVNLFVGTRHVRLAQGLDSPVSDGDEVVILPAVSGG